MTHLQKLRLHPVFKWVSKNLFLNIFILPKYPINRHTFSCYNVDNSRFFCSLALNFDVNENNCESRILVSKISPKVKKEVESVLFDYLYSTRSLPFSDAEHMSKHSPHFVKKLVENVRNEVDIRRSMSRFLRYHPINEFEPFFESIGLKPWEFCSLLPHNLMYLSDEVGLLDNYHVLCGYMARDKIGKIYIEAREVFRYGHGILQSKLLAFEEVRIIKNVIAKVVWFNPSILISGLSKEFVELVIKLNCLGCENSWFEQRLVESTSYNWRRITQLQYLLHDICGNDEGIRMLVNRSPGLLFDHSGRPTISLIGFLLKFGFSKTGICSFITEFPQVKIENFVWNLRRVFELLCEIDMDPVIIGTIIREHFTWMGTCSLKKANSIRTDLNTGNKHMCQIIIANPMELKNWTLGAKIERVPETREVRYRSDTLKFLTSIGFTENSKEIEKALKALHGKGDELLERFNCLVIAGLEENDVAQMIKASPKILNQSVEVLETKISVLVSDLGFPVSCLRRFPGYLSYSMERVKMRCAMYSWLIGQNVVRPTFSLGIIIGYPESYFVDKYVSKHPRGPEVWQNYKQTFSSL